MEVANYKEISLDDRGNKGIVLCHYPIPCFNHHYYGWYHLYGHVHNSFEWKMMEHDKYLMSELYNVPCHMYNVGSMLWYMNYTPKTLDQIVNNSFEWKMMEHDKYLMSELYNVPCHMYNVGSMLWYMNYTPKTLDQIVTSSAIQNEIEF